MKVTVLVDNNTYIDEYFLGEPAVSYYIEDQEKKILLDTGYSNIFISNAEKMGIDLKQIDTIVFSHGHNDHTRGFKYLNNYMNCSNIQVIAHPLCFNTKLFEEEDIGAPFKIEKMKDICKLKLSNKPMNISDNIVFLGEIPSMNSFENRKRIGIYDDNGTWKNDFLKDDSAIVYKNENGLFIITGCSHSGICNIIEYAKEVCHDDKIIGVIGGFHLFEVDDELIKTIEYLKANHIKHFYPCHCVSLKAKVKMSEQLNISEVGVGLTINI